VTATAKEPRQPADGVLISLTCRLPKRTGIERRWQAFETTGSVARKAPEVGFWGWIRCVPDRRATPGHTRV